MRGIITARQRKPRRILIAGQGATASVFAAHLARAGAEPALLRAGAPGGHSRLLHRFRLGGRLSSEQLTLTAVESIDALPRPPDQLWLCLPSTALESDWLRQQLAQLRGDTMLVCWSPDLRDRARLRQHYAGPLLQGLALFPAFATPQPWLENLSDGVAYALPVPAALLDRCRAGSETAALLRAGGMTALTSRDLPWLTAQMAAALVPLAAALECCHWSSGALRQSPLRALARQASEEALRVSAVYLDRRPGRRLPRQLLKQVVSRLIPGVAPFPIAAYLRHYSQRQRAQTRLMLDSWLVLARQQLLPCHALFELRQMLR